MLHHRLRGAGGLVITKISDVISTGETITVMSGVKAGDLLVFFDFANRTSDYYTIPSAVTPSGFTLIHSFGENYIQGTGAEVGRWSAYYKIATGTESSTTLTGMDSDRNRKCLLLFRGTRQISSVAINSVVSGVGGTGAFTTATSTITSSAGDNPFLIFGFIGCYAEYYTSTTSFTASWSGETMSSRYIINDTENVAVAAWTIKNYNITANNVGISSSARSTYTWNYFIHGHIGFYLELE